MAKKKEELGVWLVETEGGGRFVIWSEFYKNSEKKAVAKFRRLTNGCFTTLNVTARLLSCTVDNCWSFARHLLRNEELEGIPKEWRAVGDVEVEPGATMNVDTVCPMCEKHASRFRKTLRERVLMIEERLDKIELSLEIE